MTAIESALRWLEQREPPPPAELQRRLQRSISRSVAAATLSEILIDAAFMNLLSASRRGDQRTAANELLAADALLTYAIEAAAEDGVDELQRVLDTVGPRRFEQVMSERE